MDYDRYDAILHYIFKQTQGDAWFRPDARDIAAGVCLRDEGGAYLVFPYENLALEPFEQAVRAMGLVVAVKVRSAVAHAAVSEACVLLIFSFRVDFFCIMAWSFSSPCVCLRVDLSPSYPPPRELCLI